MGTHPKIITTKRYIKNKTMLNAIYCKFGVMNKLLMYFLLYIRTICLVMFCHNSFNSLSENYLSNTQVPKIKIKEQDLKISKWKIFSDHCDGLA